METPDGPAWLEPVRGHEDTWLQLGPCRLAAEELPRRARSAAGVLGMWLAQEREANMIAGELSTRYEEIDLLYTISDILGGTVRLEEAARTIARELSDVVGARRASIMVHDEATRTLRVVGGHGLETYHLQPVPVDHPASIAARVFREESALAHDGSSPPTEGHGGEERGYKGASFLSVPITYTAPGGAPRTIGVMNLTDRLGEDRFTAGHQKLMGAIASQVGAAIENVRLAEGERRRERLNAELEVARELQIALMPPQAALAEMGDIGAVSQAAESIGGDFYDIIARTGETIGVTMGDVSGHNVSAALLMANAISAAGVLAQASTAPEEMLRRLLELLEGELARTEMYMALFYGVVDDRGGMLRYANAGLPHAFVVPGGDGEPLRLAATAPPLGLSDTREIGGAQVEWRRKSDLLVLFTDGLADSRDGAGEVYREERVLDVVRRNARKPAREIVEEVFRDVTAFAGEEAGDDRTLLVLRR